MAYLTLAEFQSRLGITPGDQDEYQQNVLDAVEIQIKQYLGYDPEESARTEYYSGTGTPFLALIGFPVASEAAVTAVYEDTGGFWGQASGGFASGSLLTKGTDYAVRTEGNAKSAILVRLTGVWQPQWYRQPTRLAPNLISEFGSVKVTYTSGYDEDEIKSIAQAGYLEAAAQWKAAPNGAGLLLAEGLDGYNYSFANADSMRSKMGSPRFLSPMAEAILRPYRHTAFGGL